jgi:hypothetical protein
MKCLVSLWKVSKMSAVELSYERNNLARCWFKIALLGWDFWVSETQILSRLKIVDSLTFQSNKTVRISVGLRSRFSIYALEKLSLQTQKTFSVLLNFKIFPGDQFIAHK